MKNTFVPYLILLLLLISGIYQLDRLAEKYSKTPEVIRITAGSKPEMGQSFWEYEFEDTDSPDEQVIWKQDSLYVKASNAYENQEWDIAAEYYSALLSKYPGETNIRNSLGLTYYKADNYDAAVESYKQALEIDPSYTPAYINLGIVRTHQHKYDEAEQAYTRAIQLQENNPKPYLNLGILYTRQERWQEARAVLRKSIELSSGDLKARAHYYSGLANRSVEDTISAEDHFNEAVLLKPGYLLPRIQLGLLEQDPEKRKAHLQDIIKLHPNYGPAYYYLAKLYSEENKLEDARTQLTRAIQANPTDLELHAELGEIYLRENKLPEAERIFSEMTGQHGLLPQNYFYMAKLEYQRENYQEALDLYNRAVEEANGYYPEALLNKGLILQNIDREEEAIQVYKQAIDLKSDYAEAYYNLALLYQRREDYSEALTNYQSALDIDPSYHKALYNAGIVYDEIEEPDSSITYFRRAIEVKPDYVKARLNLGVMYSDQEKYDEAIESYRELLEQYPNYVPALFNLGLAYRKSDQIDRAIETYELVLEKEPENASARKNLGVLYIKQGEIGLAIALYETGIELTPYDPEIRFNLALQYEKEERYNDAITQLNKAIQLRPDYEKAHEKLLTLADEQGSERDLLAARSQYFEQFGTEAEEAYELGREWHRDDAYIQAVTWYAKAITLGKDDDWSYYWMGKAQMESGNVDEAIESFNRALKRDHTHKFAHLRLAQIYKDREDDDQAVYHYTQVLNLDPDYDRNNEIKDIVAALQDKEI